MKCIALFLILCVAIVWAGSDQSVMRSIEEQLILHEGIVLMPYYCTEGYLTIGIGRNLDTRGLSEAEALFLLANDIASIEASLQVYSWYRHLDPIRKKVIVDMVFNLGLEGFLLFKKTIEHLENKDYRAASKEMLDSKWAEQVGQRAIRLSRMMATGRDYTN